MIVSPPLAMLANLLLLRAVSRLRGVAGIKRAPGGIAGISCW